MKMVIYILDHQSTIDRKKQKLPCKFAVSAFLPVKVELIHRYIWKNQQFVLLHFQGFSDFPT